MNLFTYTYTQKLTARFAAAVTIVSLFLSAFPVAFFVAQASVSDTLYDEPTEQAVDTNTDYVTTAIDTTGHTNVSLSFDFNLQGPENDPGAGLDSKDAFNYGWQIGSDAGTRQQLGTVAGKDTNHVQEIGSIINTSLPSGAENISDIRIYFEVVSDAGFDTAHVTNVLVAADSVAAVETQPVIPYPDPLNGKSHVEICHSANGKNYAHIDPNVDAIVTLPNGHDDHDYDIIPPFTYNLGDKDLSYLGKNWDADGIARWEADCANPEGYSATVDLTKVVTGEDNADLSQFDLLVDGAAYTSGDQVLLDMEENSATDVVVGEGAVPDGYTLTSVSCTVNTKDPVISTSTVTLELKDGDEAACTITNNKTPDPEKSVTIMATKIMCDDESLLPNDGYTTIGETTAADFLAQNPGCHAEPNWQFQWALGGIKTDAAPDNAGELTDPWNTSAMTDANGEVTMSVSEDVLGKNTQLSVREVMQDGYVPFSGKAGSDVSAELYCHTNAQNYDNLDWIQGVELDQTYYCVAWNAPKKAEVTMCKVDEAGAPLAGWQLSLLGEKQGETVVYPDGTTYSTGNVTPGSYVLKATGAYVYRSGGYEADAAFSERKEGDAGFGTYPYTPWRATNPLTGHLGVRVNGDSLVWGDVFSPIHTYYSPLAQIVTAPIEFTITDDNYGDNSGSILVEGFTGYTGVTDDTGCVTFTGVPYGTYTAEELLQPGWTNVSGLGDVTVDEDTETFTVVNSDRTEEPPVTLVASKIVCTEESDLPNWGAGGPDITADTAADWVASHDSCRFVEGWDFEWATAATANPDTDPTTAPLYGTAGGDWNLFGPTNASGTVSEVLDPSIFETNDTFWVREVLQNGYIPFTYGPNNKTNADDYTAELYCHTDVMNYDNYDKVAGVEAGGTYYCVAWNTPEPAPQCIDGGVAWADEVVDVDQGLRKDGGTIAVLRSDETQVLGAADWSVGDTDNFFSMGLGGTIVLKFARYVVDVTGDDLRFYEATQTTNYPTEKAKVEVSQNGTDWYPITEEISNYANEGALNTTAIDFSETGLEWILYVKIIDTTDASLFPYNDADGYDLDAVEAIETVCDEPEPAPMCSLEMVSDTQTLVVDTNEFAVATYVHPTAWTALIPGATWIWEAYQVIDPVGTTTRTFEKTFTVDDPENAILTVNADNGYKVYINGNLFADRSDLNNYTAASQKVYDITSELVSGDNIVEFEVINFPQDNGRYQTNPAGLLFKITLDGTGDSCLDTTDRDTDDGDGGDGDPDPDPVVTVLSSGGGGGSSAPKCELEAKKDTNGVRLTWETSRADELSIAANGLTFYTTDDDATVDAGTFYPYILGGDTEFVMTVSKGSKDRTCSVSVDRDAPEGRVLGEQVSVIPLGAADAGAGGSQPVVGTTVLQPVILQRRKMHE